MANSYATSEVVECPHCSTAFRVQLWLILDVRERPDLLERVKDGTLRAVHCPNCRQELWADASLLLYDPGATARFVFSPPEEMPAEQASEEAFQLVTLFRERAGRRWRDEWLGDGLSIVPRDQLRFDLLVELKSRWQQAMQAARSTQDIQKVEVVEQAVRSWKDILNHPDFQRLPEQFQWAAVNNAGGVLLRRFQLIKQRADLDEAISLFRLVAEHMSSEDVDRAGLLDNLGLCFKERFDLTGDRHDLELALEHFQAALQLARETFPQKPIILGRLGEALLDYYNRTGNPDDMEQSIRLHAQVLDLVPSDSPDRVIALVGLGNGLRYRYLRLGGLADLTEAIDAYTEAGRLIAPDDPHRAALLVNLAGALNQRYESSAAPDDLEQAIVLARQGLECSPLETDERFGLLNTLASAWHNRYRETGNLSDLEQVIAWYEECLALDWPNATDRAGLLSNLGYALRDRFEHTNATADLDRSIAACLQALDLVPPHSPPRAMLGNSLGRGLEARYGLTRSSSDLEQAIASYRQACELGFMGALVEGTLRASQSWGRWALTRGAWGEAVEAYSYGVQAAANLFRTQLLREDKETWLRQVQDLHIRAAYAFARDDKLPESVVALEQGRARLLAEAMERGRRDLERLPALGYSALFARYVDAVARLAELSSAQRRRESLAPGVDLMDELRMAGAEVDAAIESIQKIPGYEDFFRAPTFEQIQHVLTTSVVGRGGPAVGVYLICAPFDSLALIVHPGGVCPLWLDFTEGDLDRLLVRHEGQEVVGGYLLGQLGAGALLGELNDVLATLGEQIMHPIADTLQDILRNDQTGPRAVVLIPTGRLTLLPLHAARYRINGQEKTSLDDLVITYAPSVHVLGRSRETLESRPGTQRMLLGVGNPLPLPDGTASLLYARPEVEEIALLFGEQAELLCETEATRSAVEQHLGAAAYLHFSCHGLFEPGQPLQSGLVCSRGEMITLSDLISQRRLDAARLAVLSACQTAITDFARLPEEVIGLPAGFLQAGVPGVVGTLWPVNDLSTALLMIRFYEYHLRGDAAAGEGPVPPARALRKAQLWLRDVTNAELGELFDMYRKAAPQPQMRMAYELAQERFREHTLRDPYDCPFTHPYHWAPFAFYGV